MSNEPNWKGKNLDFKATLAHFAQQLDIPLWKAMAMMRYAQKWMNASMGKPIKHKHIVVMIEPNGTVGLYEDGISVKQIDFWIQDKRKRVGGGR